MAAVIFRKAFSLGETSVSFSLRLILVVSMILVKSHRDACCCSARTFQTPTWKLIAASAIHHLLKKNKKNPEVLFSKMAIASLS